MIERDPDGSVLTEALPVPEQAPEATQRQALRLAAIDVGSNAIRFLAARFDGETAVETLGYERVPIRLGHSAFLSGFLEENLIARAVAAFRGFRAELDRLGIEHVRCVATSAVRESENGRDFVRRVSEASRIRVETISGGEEARLVWMAVRERMDLGDSKWMLMDLGGGSVEVSLVDAEGVVWAESHTMGSVRLLEQLQGDELEPGIFRRLLAEYAATLRIPAAARHWNAAGLIATGGNIEELASLAGAAPDERGVGRLMMEDLHRTIEMLGGLSVEERMRTLGLREDRADVILPAAVVYARLGELTGVESILVPNVGVKEGVLYDLVEEVSGAAEHQSRLERVVYLSAVGLGRRYLFDEAHATHVTSLCLSLFDQLKHVHGLDADDRRLLVAGALLHDVGQFISFRRHHKHSRYLIEHSDLSGVAPREIPLVALVARYHRRTLPRDRHYLYRDLSDDQRRRVRGISAILRIADALDREHVQLVTSVEAEVSEGRLILRPTAEGDLILERWALEQKSKLFEAEYGFPVRLEYD